MNENLDSYKLQTFSNGFKSQMFALVQTRKKEKLAIFWILNNSGLITEFSVQLNNNQKSHVNL